MKKMSNKKELGMLVIAGLLSASLMTGCTATDDTVEDESTTIEENVGETESVEEEEEQGVITIEDEQFKKVMTTLLTDNAYASYFATIDEREIEFDGSIDFMDLREGYGTRYELLLSYGDYSETSSTGPSIKVKDIAYGTRFSREIPGPKTNVKVRAKVDKYDIDKGYLLINVISIERR